MLRSFYRTLLTYTIFRKYFATIFIIILGLISIIEISFFYSDIFEFNTMKEPSILIYTLFGLKWSLIFGFTLYFFYSLYTFKPQKGTVKEVIEKKPSIKKEKKTQALSSKTEAKLDRILHKKKLQTKADKIIQSR
jgi:hypothetical protein